MWAFGVSREGLGVDSDFLWQLTHREFDALRSVYVEGRGGKPEKGAKGHGAMPSEWPSQPLADKKACLRQALELASVIAKQKKEEAAAIQRTAAAQVQPPPKRRRGT